MEPMETVEAAYGDALEGSGVTFREAEARLLEGGGEAASFLRERAGTAEGALASLVTHALLARVEEGGALSRALADLEEMRRKALRTAAGGPSPAFVSGFLETGYGPGLAPLMAAYLYKLWTVWPGWMTAGVALYVGEQGGPEVSDALLPMALATRDPFQREVAARALALTGDPALAARLEAVVAEAPDDLRPEVLASADDIRRRIEAFA